MGYPTKIATCCYCGSKTVLKLDRGRHELACANCGAPLRDLKMLQKEPLAKPAVSHLTRSRRDPSGWPAPGSPQRKIKAGKKKRKRPAKRHKRSGWIKELAEEVFDFVEDIFD
tara:strand:- start:195 stop:533 length:339 start_codon:yes stop_codon:yes gene_type:complete